MAESAVLRLYEAAEELLDEISSMVEAGALVGDVLLFAQATDAALVPARLEIETLTKERDEAIRKRKLEGEQWKAGYVKVEAEVARLRDGIRKIHALLETPADDDWYAEALDVAAALLREENE